MVHISKTRGAFHPNPGFGSDVFVARVKHRFITLDLAYSPTQTSRRYTLAAILISVPPLFSGKYLSNGTLGNLALKTLILFKNRVIDTVRTISS